MTESELLFTCVLGCKMDELYLNRDECLTLSQAHFISSALKRRILGEPIHYILGEVEFMGFKFKLNKDVLIPRPETEILVETVLKYAGKGGFCNKHILEIGAGSGCIAISLARLLSDYKITSTDISLKALNLAISNAKLNGVEDRVIFVLSDLFSALSKVNNQYSICVTNPPYIPSSEINKLQREVRFEPKVALDGGRDGLKFYRSIISRSSDYIETSGILIMEIGFGQSYAIKEIFSRIGKFEIIEIVKDYNNLERFIVARKG